MKLVAGIFAFLAFLAFTALGLYVGWAFETSYLPPHGGGWRCYRDCVVIVWIAGFIAMWTLRAVCHRIAEAFADLREQVVLRSRRK
jgi:hypothetical protein